MEVASRFTLNTVLILHNFKWPKVVFEDIFLTKWGHIWFTKVILDFSFSATGSARNEKEHPLGAYYAPDGKIRG